MGKRPANHHEDAPNADLRRVRVTLRHPFLRITLPLAGMNFINQAARGMMAVVGPVLAAQYGLTASELGLLASAAFASYCLWQLPVGLLLDVWGPRMVQTSMGLTAAAGFALFAVSDGMVGFVLARLLIGVGIAAGLMALLKAHSVWFGRAQVAGMTGIAMLIAASAGLVVTAPMEALLPRLGWRGVFWCLFALVLAVRAWVFASVRERVPAVRRPLSVELAVLRAILLDARFWRLTPMVALMSVFTFTYQGLWAGPWLRDVAGQDSPARAATLFCYALGLMAGSLLTGQLASRLQARGHSAMLVPAICAGLLVGLQLVLLVQPTDPVVLDVLWFVVPLIAAAGPPGYAAIAQHFPVEQTGRVSTAINTVVLGGAFVLQTLIGWVLDFWPRTATGWDRRGYAWAMGLSVLLQTGALIWAWHGRGWGRGRGRLTEA